MKYLSSILLVVSAVTTAFAPSVQGMLSAHPTAVSIVYTVWGILNHFLPQPSATK